MKTATAAHPSRTPLPEHNLDLLRAVAVLGVLADHTTAFMGLGSQSTQWLGHSGVQAFFVHTSLVLMASLERDGAPARPRWVWRFYLRRAFRIYPLALVVIGLVILLRIPPGSPSTSYHVPSREDIIANLALMQNLTGSLLIFSPSWTLPLELQMYAVLPICYLIALRNSRAWTLALIAAGLATTGIHIWGIQPSHRIPGMWRFTLAGFNTCFLMGIMAYSTLRRRQSRPWIPAWTWVPILLLNIGVMSLAWSAFQEWWVVRSAFCAVIGIAIPMVKDTAPSPLTRVGHTIATYSYGIYLVHLLALRVGFVAFRGQPVAIQLAVAAAVLVVSSYAAYHLIEKPGIELGRRLLGQRRGPPSLEATAPAP